MFSLWEQNKTKPAWLIQGLQETQSRRIRVLGHRMNREIWIILCTRLSWLMQRGSLALIPFVRHTGHGIRENYTLQWGFLAPQQRSGLKGYWIAISAWLNPLLTWTHWVFLYLPNPALKTLSLDVLVIYVKKWQNQQENIELARANPILPLAAVLPSFHIKYSWVCRQSQPHIITRAQDVGESPSLLCPDRQRSTAMPSMPEVPLTQQSDWCLRKQGHWGLHRCWRSPR